VIGSANVYHPRNYFFLIFAFCGFVGFCTDFSRASDGKGAGLYMIGFPAGRKTDVSYFLSNPWNTHCGHRSLYPCLMLGIIQGLILWTKTSSTYAQMFDDGVRYIRRCKQRPNYVSKELVRSDVI
jgi:hypothetical protein